MKIDTETTEPDVLAGGMETLTTVRPWVVARSSSGRPRRPWLFTPEPLPPAFATHYAAWLKAIRTARH